MPIEVGLGSYISVYLNICFEHSDGSFADRDFEIKQHDSNHKSSFDGKNRPSSKRKRVTRNKNTCSEDTEVEEVISAQPITIKVSGAKRRQLKVWTGVGMLDNEVCCRQKCHISRLFDVQVSIFKKREGRISKAANEHCRNISFKN